MNCLDFDFEIGTSSLEEESHEINVLSFTSGGSPSPNHYLFDSLCVST